MRQILITQHQNGGHGCCFDVAIDGKTTADTPDGKGSLNFDEMLGMIVSLCVPWTRPNLSWLKTPEEWEEYRLQRERRIVQREGVNPTTPIAGL